MAKPPAFYTVKIGLAAIALGTAFAIVSLATPRWVTISVQNQTDDYLSHRGLWQECGRTNGTSYTCQATTSMSTSHAFKAAQAMSVLGVVGFCVASALFIVVNCRNSKLETSENLFFFLAVECVGSAIFTLIGLCIYGSLFGQSFQGGRLDHARLDFAFYFGMVSVLLGILSGALARWSVPDPEPDDFDSILAEEDRKRPEGTGNQYELPN
ncbi:unnamed protein product [Owenia fusiformis]|uniref:Claudin n=1 Tax=Owenia fusiformis TaxID=6347 RepID=A0A8S4PGQ6_OWEFU|nr:unnamed protein product [Owenia fusiformis]